MAVTSELPIHDGTDLPADAQRTGVDVILRIEDGAEGYLFPLHLDQTMIGTAMRSFVGMFESNLEQWVDGPFGMAWSALTLLVGKFQWLIKKMIASAPENPPYPDVPKGADPVLHLIHYVIGALPAQMSGGYLVVYADESGEVTATEWHDAEHTDGDMATDHAGNHAAD